jgi:drug/metabolite transporter (DMT)-like permease
MTQESNQAFPASAASWTIVVAFALVYLSWGTTYFAIRQGVHVYHLPPALFGGVRVCLAGLVLLLYLRLRGEPVRLSGRGLRTAALGGVLLFVGGNGFITVALNMVPSGVTAVLVATTPLWIALLETVWPAGERLTVRGWSGLLVGLIGVLVLLAPKLQQPDDFFQNGGPFLVLASALSWSLGSLVVRYGKRGGSHLTTAAYQMVLGGGGLALVGLILGEATQLTSDRFTFGAWLSFFYLLVVGSLVGFVAFNWLLGQVSAAMVGTYAYVNPVVAIVVGFVLGHEEITGWILGGMIIILAGVALVRGGGRQRARSAPPGDAARAESNGQPLPAAANLGLRKSQSPAKNVQSL